MSSTSFGSKSIGEKEWKPHGCNIATNPEATTDESPYPVGPDWTSSLRYINVDNEEPKQKEVFLKKRHFRDRNETSDQEWSFYWDGTKYGRRCNFNGVHPGNLQTTKEIIVEDSIGSKLKGMDPRGGMECLAPGDKSYSVPEYSKDFHKEGSTLPAIDFSRSNKLITDTFIPLQPLPKQKSMTFVEKEVDRKHCEEMCEVKQLDDWTPAPKLAPGLS